MNGGLFKVPWEDTKRVLENGNIDMLIVSPPDASKAQAPKQASAQVAKKRKHNAA